MRTLSGKISKDWAPCRNEDSLLRAGDLSGGGVLEAGRGCGAVAVTPTPAPAAATPPKLLVMATIAPMYCFTKNVAGDLADVEMIVPAGVAAGAFEPIRDVTTRIMQADVVVENGFGFEGWMDQLEAQGLRPGEVRVIAARGTGPGMPGLLAATRIRRPRICHPKGLGPPDPHVWLDPLMAIKEVQNIRDALMARDPAHANDYLANENQYEAALRDLDDEVGRMTVDIPKRRLLCVGGAFTYFLSQYEFTVTATVQTVADALKVDPKSADAILVQTAADATVLNGKGLRAVQADPMESGPASTDFYENATRANVQALREGLLR